MKRVIYSLTIGTILLGIIALSLNTLFNAKVVTYISQININGIVMQKLDVFSYLKNVEQSITNVAQLELRLWTRTWITKVEGNDIFEWLQNFWSVFSNNMAYILDVIIGVANIFLYPIRIIFYAIQIILSIIGLPMQDYAANPLGWLIRISKFLTELQIPYV